MDVHHWICTETVQNSRETAGERCCAALFSVYEKIEENDKVFILASFLPPSREQLVMNILAEKTTHNFNEAVVYLLEAESLKKLQESLFSGYQALTLREKWFVATGEILCRGGW